MNGDLPVMLALVLGPSVVGMPVAAWFIARYWIKHDLEEAQRRTAEQVYWHALPLGLAWPLMALVMPIYFLFRRLAQTLPKTEQDRAQLDARIAELEKENERPEPHKIMILNDSGQLRPIDQARLRDLMMEQVRMGRVTMDELKPFWVCVRCMYPVRFPDGSWSREPAGMIAHGSHPDLRWSNCGRLAKPMLISRTRWEAALRSL